MSAGSFRPALIQTKSEATEAGDGPWSGHQEGESLEHGYGDHDDRRREADCQHAETHLALLLTA